MAMSDDLRALHADRMRQIRDHWYELSKQAVAGHMGVINPEDVVAQIAVIADTVAFILDNMEGTAG